MRHQTSAPVMVRVNFINDLKKYNLYTTELQKNFTISENKIIANTEVFIVIDLHDYSETMFIESKDYYLLPGILTINTAEEKMRSWTLPFNYQVKLMKSAEIEEIGKTITLRYQPGETIIQQKVVEKTFDAGVLEKLLEGHTKYLNKPELFVFALLEFLGGLELVTIETIVQNMFRDANDKSMPARLTDYSDYEIIGQKKLPFVTSWVS